MIFAARALSRRIVRAPTRFQARPRTFTTAVSENASTKELEKYLAQEKDLSIHAAETADLWRKISFYVCVPAIATCVAWVYNTEADHAAHVEHIKEENGGELPETPGYDYMNRRSKPFPWGPNSLFFNPHVNKDLSDA